MQNSCLHWNKKLTLTFKLIAVNRHFSYNFFIHLLSSFSMTSPLKGHITYLGQCDLFVTLRQLLPLRGVFVLNDIVRLLEFVVEYIWYHSLSYGTNLFSLLFVPFTQIKLLLQLGFVTLHSKQRHFIKDSKSCISIATARKNPGVFLHWTAVWWRSKLRGGCFPAF